MIIIHGTEVQVHCAEDDEKKIIDVLEKSITNDEEEAKKLQQPKPSSFEHKAVKHVLLKNNTTCKKIHLIKKKHFYIIARSFK